MGRDIQINVGAKDNASAVLGRVSASLDVMGKNVSRVTAGASRSLKMIGSSVAVFGGAITGALALATESFANAGDEIHKMALRTGVSAEGLSELAFAAEQSGASLSVIEKGIKGMQRSLFDAERGSSEMVDSLEILGLTAADLTGKLPEDQFTILADAIGGIEDPSKRAAVAMKIFGKSGAEMLPLFSEGAGGIAKLRQEANELGRTMTGADAQAAADYTDAMNRMKSVVVGLKNQIGSALAPTITILANRISGATKSAVAFIKEHKGLVVGLAAIGVGATVAGGILVGLGITVASVGVAISGLGAIAGTAATVIGAVFTPVGLVIGAVAGAVLLVGAGFIFAAHKTGLLSDALGAAKNIMLSVWETAKTTFTGISDALSSGNWALAAQVGWAGVKVAFWKGLGDVAQAFTLMMPKMWETVKSFFNDFVMGALKSSATVAKMLTNPFYATKIAMDFVKDGLQFDSGASGGIAGYVEGQRDAAEKELKMLTETARSEAAKIQAAASGQGIEDGIKNQISRSPELPKMDIPGFDASKPFKFELPNFAGAQQGLGLATDTTDWEAAAAKINTLGETGDIDINLTDDIKKQISEIMNLPKIELPEFDIPKIPKFDMPTFDTPDVAENQQQKKATPAELQASESRFLTRGRTEQGIDKVAKNTEQTNQKLADIAKLLPNALQSKTPVNQMQMVMIS